MQLEGKRILVTGASSGIGRAIAEHCVREGARVLATGRRADALEELDGVRRYACDLLEAGAPEACVAEGVAVVRRSRRRRARRRHGAPRRGSPRLRRRADGGMALANFALPQRVARAALGALGRGGSLVLVSSQLGRIGGSRLRQLHAPPRAASTRSCARSRWTSAPTASASTRVAPGVVRTPMAYQGRDNFDELVPAIAERHPLRRIGRGRGHGRARGVPALGRLGLDDRPDDRSSTAASRFSERTHGTDSPHRHDRLQHGARARVLARRPRRRARHAAGEAGRLLRGDRRRARRGRAHRAPRVRRRGPAPRADRVPLAARRPRRGPARGRRLRARLRRLRRRRCDARAPRRRRRRGGLADRSRWTPVRTPAAARSTCAIPTGTPSSCSRRRG